MKALLKLYYRLFATWKPLKYVQPKENETIWFYDTKNKHIVLGCYVYIDNEGWFFAISNGIIYSENRQITTESDIDDDYEFTHFSRLPKLPK